MRSVRNRYKENQLFFTEDQPPASNRKPWICFDEIHKIPKWKNALKAIFDSTSENYHFIVTGSAKLDIFKKAGDSLSGRYFNFHLFPLSLSELQGFNTFQNSPPSRAFDFITQKMNSKPSKPETLSSLLEYSGFPEPFLKQSKIFYKKWSEDYADTVIQEDIGALTQIIAKENLYDLYQLLPEMVGNPLSESSLAAHLEISHPTIKNYLKRLEDFYLTFKVHPYSKNIKRSLLKSPKCYLYNWAQVSDPGKRFENYAAVELKSLLYRWHESSAEDYALFYLRNKEREETDFLILKNKLPWMLVEVKLSDGSVDRHQYKMQASLGGIPIVQVCRQENICKMEGKNVFRISASRFFV